MTPPLRHIGIDFGELRHFHDGLGEFSRQFGLHLANRANELRHRHNVALSYHLPGRWHGMFGDKVSYMDVSKGQRYWHRTDTNFDVWHNLHQLIRQRPPMGTRHVMTTLHDLNMVYAKRGFSRWRALRKQIRILKRADEVICISDYVLGDFKRYARLDTPASRIYNGVRSLADHAQHAIALPFDQPFFFHIGRMTPNKNVGCLLDLAIHWPNRNFVFAGPKTSYTEAHQRFAQERALRNVCFVFDVTDEQKAWLYAHSEGLLLPSLTEGFGLPAVEAMWFGKPVYLSRATSLPEIGGPVATYFDAFDPSSMQQTIMDAENAPKIGHQAAAHRQRWAEQFAWPVSIETYIQRYISMLARP